MDLREIELILRENLNDCHIEVEGEGNKLGLKLVSDDFVGLSRVKRQQKVYGLLDDKIKSGEIHAVSMTTLTTDEHNNRGSISG
jgi:acid stress-induced BolA-like protein IbaG/YrbA